jgi:hypothetical protein
VTKDNYFYDDLPESFGKVSVVEILNVATTMSFLFVAGASCFRCTKHGMKVKKLESASHALAYLRAVVERSTANKSAVARLFTRENGEEENLPELAAAASGVPYRANSHIEIGNLDDGSYKILDVQESTTTSENDIMNWSSQPDEVDALMGAISGKKSPKPATEVEVPEPRVDDSQTGGSSTLAPHRRKTIPGLRTAEEYAKSLKS